MVRLSSDIIIKEKNSLSTPHKLHKLTGGEQIKIKRNLKRNRTLYNFIKYSIKYKQAELSYKKKATPLLLKGQNLMICCYKRHTNKRKSTEEQC